MIRLGDLIRQEKEQSPRKRRERRCRYCGHDLPSGRITCCGAPACVRERDRDNRNRRAEAARRAHERERRQEYQQFLAEFLQRADTATDEALVDWLMTRIFLQR